MPKVEPILSLSKREEQIVNATIYATIYLWKVNLEEGFVPDFHLLKYPELSMDIMRKIRDLVQLEKNHA